MTVVFTYHRVVPVDFRIRWFTLLDEKKDNRRTNQYPRSSLHSSLSRLPLFLCHVEHHRLGFLPRFISFLVQSSQLFFNLCDMQAIDKPDMPTFFKLLHPRGGIRCGYGRKALNTARKALNTARKALNTARKALNTARKPCRWFTTVFPLKYGRKSSVWFTAKNGT